MNIHRLKRFAITLLCSIILLLAGLPTPPAAAGSITITPNAPAELDYGDLSDAAAFAWNQFIALNWPAKPIFVPGAGIQGYNRGEPDQSFYKFGDTSVPLVWQTYRNKVEIYPGQPWSSPPPFSASPEYNYASNISVCPSGQQSPRPPFVNLDESNEIGRATMYAGNAPGEPGSAEQQFLYLAKANQKEYDYVTAPSRRWDKGIPKSVRDNTINYIAQYKSYPAPDSNNNTQASFPYGTIEVKSAWRRLNATEKNNGRFLMSPVRYYEKQGNGYCFTDSNTDWGMAALHIMIKTEGAPYFIFATFSQADNIVDAQGHPVEDDDGRLNPFINFNGNSIGSQFVPPLTPDIKPSSAPPRGCTNADPWDCNGKIYEQPATGTRADQLQSFVPRTLAANNRPDKRLYYINTSTGQFVSGAALPEGPIEINRREQTIPQTVINANQSAHAAMQQYLGGQDSPLLHYKLVNVQWKPVQVKGTGQLYTGEFAPTYYLANEVVESDFNLQLFSGKFQGSTTPDRGKLPADEYQGLITDFTTASPPLFPLPEEAYLNVFNDYRGFNMGGCMGCHGVAANGGADFSFILRFAPVREPEAGGDLDEPRGKFETLLQAIEPQQ